MSDASLETFADLEAASARAASLTARAARMGVRARGRFAIALSGGSTPGRFFELLAAEDLPWDVGHVFWVDERLAPGDPSASNYLQARERLLDRAGVPEANVHPMRGDPANAVQAAQAYEETLRAFFGPGSPPAFDAVHLGMGGDGHTASLFPGQPELDEQTRWVLPVRYEHAVPPVPRLTLTLPVLNAARLVLFLVSGADKAGLARLIASGGGRGFPAALVRPQLPPVWLAAQ